MVSVRGLAGSDPCAVTVSPGIRVVFVPPATIVLVTDGSEDCPLGVNTEVMLPDVSTVTL